MLSGIMRRLQGLAQPSSLESLLGSTGLGPLAGGMHRLEYMSRFWVEKGAWKHREKDVVSFN